MKKALLNILAAAAALSMLLTSGCSGIAASKDKLTEHTFESTAPESTDDSSAPEETTGSPSISVNTYSTDVFVYDLDAAAFIMRSGTSSVIYPASTTKLLTALTALSILDPETVVEAGEEVRLIKEHSSIAYILPGHKLSVEMLIEAMLLPSGNDAAYVLAAACGKKLSADDGMQPQKAVDTFVSEMNAYAKDLGCRSSNFTSPDGFCGSEHYSTLEDMAKISAAAAQNGIITKYSRLESDDVTYASGHTNHWENSNRQLHADSEFYNQYVTGLKTGSLEDYYCLITLYERGGRYIIGVFGSEGEDDRYTDTRNIIKAIEAR